MKRNADETPKNKGKCSDKYAITSILKSDAISASYSCTLKASFQDYTMKCILKNNVLKEQSLKKLTEEIQKMKKIDSPYVVKIFDVFEEPDQYVYIVPTFKTTLQQHIRSKGFLEPKDALRMIVDVATGVNEMHMAGIKNIDLRPDSIMMDENMGQFRLVISDLGKNRHANADHLSANYDFRYQPPELIEFYKEDNKRNPTSTASDMWSLGVLYFYMLYGFIPFGHKKKFEILDEIEESSGFKFPTISDMYLGSKQLEWAHKKMCEPNPLDRLNFNNQFDMLDICFQYVQNQISFEEFMIIDMKFDFIFKNTQTGIKKIEVNASKAERILGPNGAIYTGDTYNYLKQGNGMIEYRNGERLSGVFDEDYVNGYCEQIHQDGSKSQGYLKDDQKDGFNRYSWKNGDQFEGYFKEGKRHGWGKETSANKDVFEGNFIDGKAEGFGVFIAYSGYKYCGNFHLDKKHGFGKEYFDNKEKFEGEFAENVKCGKGKYIYPDGNYYEGEYRNNLKNGEGKITYKNGNSMKGKFLDGKFNGQMCFFNKRENDSTFMFYRMGELRQGV